MDKYVINSSGKLLGVTEEKITRPGAPDSGYWRQTWHKQDILDIALWSEQKVSFGLGLVVIGTIVKRTDVTLTFVLANGDTRTYTAKNANPDEITFALRLRGWPVNGVRRTAQADNDPTEALKKLLSLHEHGLVSNEEFETKRAEVLARV